MLCAAHETVCRFFIRQESCLCAELLLPFSGGLSRKTSEVLKILEILNTEADFSGKMNTDPEE